MFYQRLLNSLTLLSILMIALGGVVHTTGASLACPDWPLCYGQIFPVMEGGILYEHSHRLLGALIGLGVLLAVFLSHRKTNLFVSQAGRLQKASYVGLVLVLCQGLLGGLTVIYRLPPAISIFHLATSMLFLAWTRYAVWCQEEPGVSWINPKYVWSAAALLYVQIVLGAVVRHSHASLSCGLEFWTCAGQWLPQTFFQWLQTFHRLTAFLVFASIIFVTLPVLKKARLQGLRQIRLLCVFLHAALLLQMILGWLTIRTMIHLHVVTSHLLLGTLLWLAMVELSLAIGPYGQKWRRLCGSDGC